MDQGEVSPVSQRDYDFRTEPVAGMDLPAVEAALGNVYKGDLKHPYFNEQDGRRGQAQEYVSALHARKAALTPPGTDPTIAAMGEVQADRRRQAEALQRQITAVSGHSFDLPPDIDPVHLGVMERDLLLYTGRLSEAFDDIDLAAQRLNSRDPSLSTALAAARDMLRYTNWRGNAILTSALSDTLLSLNKEVAVRELDRLNAARAHVKDVAAAAAERKAEGRKSIQAAQRNTLPTFVRTR